VIYLGEARMFDPAPHPTVIEAEAHRRSIGRDHPPKDGRAGGRRWQKP